MVPWRRFCSLVSLTAAAALAPASACGPFLYENADLDRFSFLDPGILNTQEWTTFLAFASPPFGQNSAGEDGDGPLQRVIGPSRVGETLSGVVNLAFEGNPGTDPVSVAANEAWWATYFQDIRGRKLSGTDLEAVLYGPDRPRWLAAADRLYLSLLDGEEDDPQGLETALAQARNPKNPLALRHRFAFWAVRALAHQGQPSAYDVFREFSPGPATDLPLARAQGWAASVVADDDPKAARDLWVDLFVRWPALRAQTFSSLTALPEKAWDGAEAPGALVARYFADGRDFSPETLRDLSTAERASGGNGSWTEAVLYSMAEGVEGEAGVFALFGLVDPKEVPPAGLFTGLVDAAVDLVDSGTQKPTRTWWLLASYLALFDGDPARAEALLGRARDFPARNAFQENQTAMVDTLVRMAGERDRDWSPDLQARVVAALDWGHSLDAVDHNRGLYHSVAVLAAQKSLARGHNAEAALAYGLVQEGGWSNPYRVEADDGFWTTGWPANDPVNLLMDALMTDDDLASWRALLRSPGTDPLTVRLVARSFLSDRDLSWWQAHRALRRGDGPTALALLKNLGAAGDDSVFPDRQFGYSLDLDPLDPGSGRGMRTVAPAVLAAVMARVEAAARKSASSKDLLAQGTFWFSVQLSGLPLLFAQPPKVISFTNGNFEYYGYGTGDVDRTTKVAADFPLGTSKETDAWSRRLALFYRDEFSTLGKARAAFEGVLARHDDPEAEVRALLFLQALDGSRFSALADPRYDGVPLATTFRSTCGDFQGVLW